mmetsp:Transcript_107322/g.269135  ORF Transcript_107322/g.269135 Transcript_107322/m.269135 type:complete len:203 (-) Transcript_107322:810-1418(-)
MGKKHCCKGEATQDEEVVETYRIEKNWCHLVHDEDSKPLRHRCHSKASTAHLEWKYLSTINPSCGAPTAREAKTKYEDARDDDFASCFAVKVYLSILDMRIHGSKDTHGASGHKHTHGAPQQQRPSPEVLNCEHGWDGCQEPQDCQEGLPQGWVQSQADKDGRPKAQERLATRELLECLQSHTDGEQASNATGAKVLTTRPA